jgi:hypothetical protein
VCRQCKDLSTPALNTLEAELKMTIGLQEYESTLDAVHAQALRTMQAESEARRDMQTQLLGSTLKQQQAVDRLDKKRKFLDELPTRVSLVKAACSDLQGQFLLHVPAATASSGSSSTSSTSTTATSADSS